jgi:hypothetical protein
MYPLIYSSSACVPVGGSVDAFLLWASNKHDTFALLARQYADWLALLLMH